MTKSEARELAVQAMKAQVSTALETPVRQYAEMIIDTIEQTREITVVDIVKCVRDAAVGRHATFAEALAQTIEETFQPSKRVWETL